jgi:hypothetical protein
MAITISQPGKRQKYLILILIFLVLVFLIILFKNFLLKPKAIEESKEMKKPPLIEIDFRVLENPNLKKLEVFEEIPALEKEFGRENPFIPY